MNFAELYKTNKAAVERALTSIWCDESKDMKEHAYIVQLQKIIKNIFAPENAMPLVQCMNLYKAVYSVSREEATKIIGDLWISKYPPFEHQYQTWKTLLNERSADGKLMSIVVTTGTGSGKTECFMMPLVYDLVNNYIENHIQALFLYPLNALMEDQKERLEEIIQKAEDIYGIRLTYAVYNGDLPEDEPSNDDHSLQAEKIRQQINLIRGGMTDEQGHVSYKYRHILYTRKQVRNTPPNILLTNPTMLEYILLRGSDQTLIDTESKSLRWVSIDETHTYVGAGAAELAMLLRRVMLAFNVQVENVRFTTSSATLGNITEQDQQQKSEDDLCEFISGISGLNINQIKVIKGARRGEDEQLPNQEDNKKWHELLRKDYMPLDKFITSGNGVYEKLNLLEAMCSRIPEESVWKLKVHYFYRVPNNGLFVKLSQHENGTFTIYTQNEINNTEEPMLELSRCKYCGQFVAIGQYNTVTSVFGQIEGDDSDMFDLEETSENSNVKYLICGLSNQRNELGDNNMVVTINGSKMSSVGVDDSILNDWHIVANTHGCCPYCNAKHTKRKNASEGDDVQNTDDSRLGKYRVSSDFIARKIAPSILNQVMSINNDSQELLHNGNQYISFVDSRQMAAKATLKQNLEQERVWVYSTIYHELCKRNEQNIELENRIKELEELTYDRTKTTIERRKIFSEIERLEATLKQYLSWMDVSELLKHDKYFDTFCSLFIKKSSGSEELDSNGNIKKLAKEKYVQSIMVDYLSKRPLVWESPETLGLFTPYYSFLQDIKLPESIRHFNEIITTDVNKISEQDWKDYLQIFIDYRVRSDQSVFLKLDNNNEIDIYSCLRFATEKAARKPVVKPNIEYMKKGHSSSRIIRYLGQLLVNDNKANNVTSAIQQYSDIIENIINDMWQTLLDNKILEIGQHINHETRQFENDRTGGYRFNLKNMGFKLYKNVYLCDTNSKKGNNKMACYRPIEVNFKNFSPYLSGNDVRMLDIDKYEQWTSYPYYQGGVNEIPTLEMVRNWAQENRKLLWGNRIWGDCGVFSDLLEYIHMSPNYYVQAEHTAQVDKIISRQIQDKFKSHKINILACSTTMEMGVDLGDLEVVLLSSVPPQPSNYKQRAGRSGRNDKVKSACITLCGSDAIGLRTLYNPLDTIITRMVAVPTVDLHSKQVVQRHINAFLVRAFGVFRIRNNGSMGQKVVDYYTPYEIKNVGGRLEVRDMNSTIKSPLDMLGEDEGTMYAQFNDKCMKPLNQDIQDQLYRLLKGTVYENQISTVVKEAQKINERCYAELNIKLEDYNLAYQGQRNTEKFKNKLRIQYLEVLNQRLLEYWATSRFIPNANMPVQIIPLDINSNGKNSFYSSSLSSNPSYSIREAIGQYVPGNSVVIDGIVYKVGGIQYTSMYRGVNSFKRIYRNDQKTVIDDPTSIDQKRKWSVNGLESVELIQPIGFVPDISYSNSRILNNNISVKVNAQLIDADVWSDVITEPHLYSARCNRTSGNAKILYYNEGIGYGYCFCTSCGKMVLENGPASDSNSLEDLPSMMNPLSREKETIKTNDDGIDEIEKVEIQYHHAVSGKYTGGQCNGSNNAKKIRRNVIIGDLIQTDYTEIRIRNKNSKQWISSRGEYEKLLITLGVVFTKTFIEIIGKDSNAVDFFITPNGHICIFDVNVGGAGYSPQLANMYMDDVVQGALKRLKEAKEYNSKEMLLDKFTLRYLKYIDIDQAITWIEDEMDIKKIIPLNISNNFNNVKEVSLCKFIKHLKETTSNIELFVTDNYKSWNYQDGDTGWLSQWLSRVSDHSSHLTMGLLYSSQKNIPSPIRFMVRSMKGWIKDFKATINPYSNDAIYPIAKIDGCLYFTNDIEGASLNEKWATNTLYMVQTDLDLLQHAISINYEDNVTMKIVKLDDEGSKFINTRELGSVLYLRMKDIIDQFIDYCNHKTNSLEIRYQDQHLKSVLGMVITLQTIEYFVKLLKKDFLLSFDVEKYIDTKTKDRIFSNLPSNIERDKLLTQMTEKWCENISTNNISGDFKKIESKEPGSLTHWRVLEIKCGDKCLSIYPDGGFANSWKFVPSKREYGRIVKFYTVDNTNTSDVLNLERVDEIKFDVAIS